MFTGIVSQTGRMTEMTLMPSGARLAVEPSRPLDGLSPGESVAVNGVCLTVEPASRPDRLQFFLSAETLHRSTLGDLRNAESVNLERALRAGDAIGGHLVMGHVDGVGTIERLDADGEGRTLEVGFPEELKAFIVPKGSIAVDGVSLTVTTVRDGRFGAAVVPHTLEATNLSGGRPGRRVNLEIDVIARYVVHALRTVADGKGGLTLEFLAKAGFSAPGTDRPPGR
jgi:riboflavin synthase alpha subunit